MITVVNGDSSQIKTTASDLKIGRSASLHECRSRAKFEDSESFFLLKCSFSTSFGVAKHSGVTINNKVDLPGIKLRKFGVPLK